MMNPPDWPAVVAEMRKQGLAFEDGLSRAEVGAAEERFGFRFPADLRAFLQTGLPKGKEFPDWRAGDEEVLRKWLDLPRDGILFDVEENGFWLKEWGPRPKDIGHAKEAAGKLIDEAPKLIPVCMHRMMPDEPLAAGNPVFSVHQTDIVCYWNDLESYLRGEFNLPGNAPHQGRPRKIRFWDADRFQGS